jgi:DNA-binding transcriptional regulator GbsR (MarR family)
MMTAMTKAAAIRTEEQAHERQVLLAEEFGLLWEEFGMMRMDGRVLGYLMLSDAPHVSSAELREALQASAGSISTTTRRLKQWGFIRQVAVPGERSHFYRAADDVWGAFLEAEDKNYGRAREFADHVLHGLDGASELPRRRFENMRDYHEWLETHHRTISALWAEHKRAHGRA